MFCRILLLSLTALLHTATSEDWNSQLIAQYGKVDENFVQTVYDKIQAAITVLNQRLDQIHNKLQPDSENQQNLETAFQNWYQSEIKSLQERGRDVLQQGLDMIHSFQAVYDELKACNNVNVAKEYQEKVHLHTQYYQNVMVDLMQRVEHCQEKPYLDCELVVRSAMEALKQGPKDLYRVNADGASVVLLNIELRMCTVGTLTRNEAKFNDLIENLRNLSL